MIAENANLRGTPTEAGKIVETLPRGASLEVLKQKGAWFLVQTNDFAGWLHGNTIRLVDGDDAIETDAENIPPVNLPDSNDRRQRIAPQSTNRRQSVRRSTASHEYIRGPRGGCYYINGSGGKTYVDRSLCN